MVGFLMHSLSVLAFGFSPGPSEMLVVLLVALLLYGGRLPEVARSWGKALAEFRRGLSDIHNDLNEAVYTPQHQIGYDPDADTPGDDDSDSTSDELTPNHDEKNCG